MPCFPGQANFVPGRPYGVLWGCAIKLNTRLFRLQLFVVHFSVNNFIRRFSANNEILQTSYFNGIPISMQIS